MWILVRVLFALGAFIHRMVFDRREKVKSGGLSCEKSGRTYFPISRTKNKMTQVVGIMVHLEFPCPFRLTKESFLDRMFKSAGLAREFQINDPRFDDLIYLACDDERLRRVLSESAQARALFIDLFEKGAERVVVDGRHLCIHGLSDHAGIAPIAAELASELSMRVPSLQGKGVDPFALKVLLVECVIWSMAGYAIGGVAESMFHPNTVVLATKPLIWRGLLGGVALATVFFVAAVLLLRRSSRSHRVLIESFMVLFLSLPVVGVQGAFDSNRAFDRSEVKVVQARVSAKRFHVRRNRRHTLTSYFLSLAPQGNVGDGFWSEIEVDQAFYEKVDTDGKIELHVRQGAFDVPWIDSMNVVEPGF